MTRKTKMGKIKLPMDVRSPKDIPAFEDMLSGGPMAVVLVYADWCGHCDTYKKNVWSPLKSMNNRTVNLASVHHDQLENTSLQGSKIDGYPSILVVGKDKKPAVFNNNSGVTNAMPNTSEVSTMKSLITTPIPNEATSMNANSSFTPTINGQPIEEGTNISTLRTALNDNTSPRNNSLRVNSPKNNSLRVNSPKNNSLRTNSLRVNSPKNNSLRVNSPRNNSPRNNSSRNNSLIANSPKTLTSLGNASPMATNLAPMAVEDFPPILPSSPRHVNSVNTPNISSNNTANFAKPTTPTATNVSPPEIDSDEAENSEPKVLPVNNQGKTPLNLKGGRLFRKLSQKKRKVRKSKKRQSKRKN